MPEGVRLTPAILTEFLDRHPETGWCWLTHCETSTGSLHDLPALTSVCHARNVRICADCVSSLGAVPVDLTGVWMASGTSGKALAAFPGVAVVLTAEPPSASPARLMLARCFDLSRHDTASGMPSTLGSNVIAALHAALHLTDWREKFAHISRRGLWLRDRLETAGFAVCGTSRDCSPAVITLTLPKNIDARRLVELAEDDGFWLAGHSDYLIAGNRIQICLMGDHVEDPVAGLPELLSGWLARSGVGGQP